MVGQWRQSDHGNDDNDAHCIYGGRGENRREIPPTVGLNTFYQLNVL